MDDIVPFTLIEQLDVRMYSEEEIEKVSVMEVTSEESINSMGHCCKGGLYDQRMGVMMKVSNDACETCHLGADKCMGHCGHIELPVPVFNPVLRMHINKLLRILCFNCARIQASPVKVLQLQYQLQLLDRGYCPEALQLSQVVSNTAMHEVKIDVDGVESMSNLESASSLLNLKAQLDAYCQDVYDGKTKLADTSSFTSTVLAVREECLKSFMASIKSARRCRHCNYPMFNVIFRDFQMIVGAKSQRLMGTNEVEEEEEEEVQPSCVQLDLTRQSVLTPLQARDLLRTAWEADRTTLLQIFAVLKESKSLYPTDIFFISKLPVIPPKYRPLMRMRDTFLEHDSCVPLKNVLRLCRCMRFLIQLMNDPLLQLGPEVRLILSEIPGSTDKQRADKVWQLLQSSVDNIFDCAASKEVHQVTKGIKQIVEKKEGLFRSNLMGKRVNFSARSVLAPDPALAVDEVGVPLDFAIHLAMPVPVNSWNVAMLRKLVINGPHTYPGAHMIESEDGRITHLRGFTEEQRTAFAKKLLTPPDSTTTQTRPCKVVYRHLMDGDLVLMNRQPTLHRLSIQAHKAKVMKGMRVLRMPYANCKAYNADFDGDEMNLHYPQNWLAISECASLVTTHCQYLTPKDGAPLAGLVQDCVVAGVMLSVRGRMFEREDYFQLVNVALQEFNAPIKTLPPAILKPRQLWSGKQIISTVLKNLIPQAHALPTFKFKTSVKSEVWEESRPRKPKGGQRWGVHSPNDMTESEFIMREGELMCGVVDKSAIGSTSYGLIHVCYDLYGGAVASKLLTAFNKLCMYYLQLFGHTIGSKEFLTPPNVARKRRKALTDLIETAPAMVLKKVEMSPDQFRQFWETNHLTKCDKNTALIDGAYSQVLGKTTSSVTTENERGLHRRALNNGMRLMVDSGAKGSKVNMNQMASLFGPTAIDGKRMPLSLAGKSLPSFAPYDMDPRFGGYISSRFMTGIDPQSYFFLCIVGRDSLQHTAVKTANSGYMQRCLIKHLEGISVCYDMTVRNSDGLVLQFEYGEDGLDVTKAPFLKDDKTLDVVVDNCVRQLSDDCLLKAQEQLAQPSILKQKKKVQKYYKKQKRAGSENTRYSAFTIFCQDQADKNSKLSATKVDRESGRSLSTRGLISRWQQLDPQLKLQYQKRFEAQRLRAPDPVLSKHCSHSKMGVMSEVLDDLIDTYYTRNYSRRDPHHRAYDKRQIEATVAMKARSAHVDPGEAVGAICAQALGEPLTQMTLNTFHFAGRDELNVTLGVPRMVEILRTASASISTPIMEIPFRQSVTRAQAEALKKKFTEVTLKQVVHSMEANVIEVDEAHRSHNNHHLVKLKFVLLPTSHYKHELPVTSREVLRFLERFYFKKGILKRLTSQGKVSDICSTVNYTSTGATSSAALKEEVDDDGGQDDEKREDSEDSRGADADELVGLSEHARDNEEDYEDDEEEEEEKPDDPDKDDDMNDVKQEEGDQNVTRVKENLSDDEDEAAIEAAEMLSTSSRRGGLSSEEIESRVSYVKGISNKVVNYEFDTVNEEWCELTLSISNTGAKYDFKSIVSNTAEKAFVHRITGIKRAFIEEKDGHLLLRTEGVNIYKLIEWAHMLDINKLYTNDIQLVARTFGIEAAQRSIIREIRAVLSAYNIEVNYRHLTLLADYFTCGGSYKACNRYSLATCQSILQQMSYESAMQFLKHAIVNGAPDRMQSPSALLATGQVVKVGTNVMDIHVDIPRCLV